MPTSNMVHEYRICHLFGILYCDAHLASARRDCEEFMRREGIVRLRDARTHNVLGPFLTALGDHIPMLRSSGTVETDWHFPYIDEMPNIKYSKNTGEWGFNLTNDTMYKFAPLSQFRNPFISPYISEDTRNMLEAVEATLIAGIYADTENGLNGLTSN